MLPRWGRGGLPVLALAASLRSQLRLAPAGVCECVHRPQVPVRSKIRPSVWRQGPGPAGRHQSRACARSRLFGAEIEDLRAHPSVWRRDRGPARARACLLRTLRVLTCWPLRSRRRRSGHATRNRRARPQWRAKSPRGGRLLGCCRRLWLPRALCRMPGMVCRMPGMVCSMLPRSQQRMEEEVSVRCPRRAGTSYRGMTSESALPSRNTGSSRRAAKVGVPRAGTPAGDCRRIF